MDIYIYIEELEDSSI